MNPENRAVLEVGKRNEKRKRILLLALVSSYKYLRFPGPAGEELERGGRLDLAGVAAVSFIHLLLLLLLLLVASNFSAP